MRFAADSIPLKQTLLIDADDTLWENNIYFERAIASFISFLNHREYSREQVRATLNEVERETVLRQGYGLTSFRHSLLTCYERLSGTALSAENSERVAAFAHSISEQEIEMLPGVAETLRELAARHRLILMTKGNEGEQADKLSRSGVADCFSAVEVPREKDLDAYTSVVRRHGLAAESAWMIGNSPRSDINPALAAGLNAVFIRHADTWVLEQDEIGRPSSGRRLLELEKFASLMDYF